MQKPLLYVRHITNLSDARYCAGMGVDMLGFVIDPTSEDYVSAEHYQQMVGWISGPKRVIEVKGSVALSEELLNNYKPDLIHVTLQQAMHLSLPDIPLILEIRYDELTSYLSDMLPLPTEHLLITDLPQNASVANRGLSILISVDKDQDHVLEYLHRTGAQGLALQGTAESAPGLKDYDHLSKILEELDV